MRYEYVFLVLAGDLVISHIRQVICLDPSDKDARKAKIFLLLQSEMYAEALNLLDAEDSKETYERAYTLYRSQRETEARDILEIIKNGEDDRGTLHLEAQLVWYLLLEGSFHFSPIVRIIEKACTRGHLTCIINFLTLQNL